MQWTICSENEEIPSWLRDNLQSTCSCCGKPMMVGANDSGRFTARRCSDENCKSMLAARLEFILKLLNVQGYGYATCYNAMMGNPFTEAIQYLSVFPKKFVVPVGLYLRLNCIKGIDSEWVTMAEKAGAVSLDDMYEAYPNNEYLLAYKDQLYRNLQYVELAKPIVERREEQLNITIMITGTPIGFANKEEFVDTMNVLGDGYIHVIHQATKRQTGVDFLIREPGSTTRGKVECAKKAGIPIVTSDQFASIMVNILAEKKGVTPDDIIRLYTE